MGPLLNNLKGGDWGMKERERPPSIVALDRDNGCQLQFITVFVFEREC